MAGKPMPLKKISPAAPNFIRNRSHYSASFPPRPYGYGEHYNGDSFVLRGSFRSRGRGGRAVGVSGGKFNSTSVASTRFRPYEDFGGAPGYFPPQSYAAFPPENFNHISPLKIFARGVPFYATRKEIRDFFVPLECANVWLGEFVDDGRSSGDAIVEFFTLKDAQKALLKHRQNIGNRYIELFPTTNVKLPPFTRYVPSHDLVSDGFPASDGKPIKEECGNDENNNWSGGSGNRIPTTTEIGARPKFVSKRPYHNSNNSYDREGEWRAAEAVYAADSAYASGGSNYDQNLSTSSNFGGGGESTTYGNAFRNYGGQAQQHSCYGPPATATTSVMPSNVGYAGYGALTSSYNNGATVSYYTAYSAPAVATMSDNTSTVTFMTNNAMENYYKAYYAQNGYVYVPATTTTAIAEAGTAGFAPPPSTTPAPPSPSPPPPPPPLLPTTASGYTIYSNG